MTPNGSAADIEKLLVHADTQNERFNDNYLTSIQILKQWIVFGKNNDKPELVGAKQLKLIELFVSNENYRCASKQFLDFPKSYD